MSVRCVVHRLSRHGGALDAPRYRNLHARIATPDGRGIAARTFDRAGMSRLPADRAHRVRAFVADTTALVLFFTVTGALNERFVSGMRWDEVLHARLLGAALMIPVARPYGMWRDWLMRRARPTRWSRIAWDSIALVTFQVPIYAAIIAISGASGRGLVLGILGATAIMLVSGRPYGAFLNWVRRRFGLPPGGEKPMSLQE